MSRTEAAAANRVVGERAAPGPSPEGTAVGRRGPRPWRHRLADYVTALALLSVLTVAYLLSVDRWLRVPPATSVGGVRERTVVASDTESLADLFPESAWQRGPCKRLKTSRGMLLFRQWEQTSPNEWKLWPITIVVGRGFEAREEEQPLIIESAEGARIEFDDSLDMMSGGAPPIRTGEIRGDVRVWRDAATSGGGDLIDIQTSNLLINERKIWTTQAIQMRIGEAVIRGEDLTLEFALGAGRIDAGSDISSILSQMELIYLRELTLPLSDQAFLSVDCGGNVRYDFAQHRLRLSESVSLLHRDADRVLDRFDCVELELSLREPMNQEIPRTGPQDWLAGVRAVGTPAIARSRTFDCDFAAESIELDVTTGELKASGRRGVQLRYGDFRGAVERLTYSFDPDEPRRWGVIDARGAGRVMWDDPAAPLRGLSWTRGLSIRNDSDPDQADVAQIVDAKGQDPRGQDPRARDVTARWLPSGSIRAWIDGSVRATLDDGGWLEADAVEGDARMVAAASGPAAGDADAGPAGRWMPERFTATGGVRARTTALEADTDSLQLFFVHHPGRGEGATGAGGVASWISPGGERQGMRPDAGRPQDPAKPTVLRGEVIAARLELAGNEVVGRDVSVQGAVELSDEVAIGERTVRASLRGHELRLREGSGESLIHLRGEAGRDARLELDDGYVTAPLIRAWPVANVIEIDSGGELQLPSGWPPSAKVAKAAAGSGGGGSRAGETGDGSAGDQGTPQADDDGWRWVRPPKVRWGRSLTFDGRQLLVLGEVRVDGEMAREDDRWEAFLRGGAVRFELTRELKLEDRRSFREAELRRVVVFSRQAAGSPGAPRPGGSQAGGRHDSGRESGRGPGGEGGFADDTIVLAEAIQRDASGELRSRHLFGTRGLTFLPNSAQRLVGDGPGWYRGWFAESPLAPDGKASGDKDPAPKRGRSPGLTGIHLAFHDAMTAEIGHRSIEFARDVRIGMRPVASWEEAFDVQRMEAIALNESTLHSERLRVQAVPGIDGGASPTDAPRPPRAGQAAGLGLESPRLAGPWEMLADGGVRFRTRHVNGLYEGSATEARYSSGQDRFTILGSAGRWANFRRTPPDGGAPISGEFEVLVLRPEDMVIEDLRWRRVTSGAPPAFERR